ncbi:MAG: TetR/AcrR family transcriptional regulator [Cyanobacteria bacterium P01_D01_bin.105]
MANKTSSERKSKGGRPASGTLAQRLEQLLEDATQVFLKHGYGSTSIDLVAREAHVAKRTIYQHFGDKDKLFGAVVRYRANTVYLNSLPAIEDSSQSLSQALEAFAHQLLDLVLLPDSIDLERIVISEARRFPELAEQFYVNGPKHAIVTLAQYLEIQNQLGAIQLDNSMDAATHFFSLVLGEFHRRVLLGIDQPYSSEQIGRHVKELVRRFVSSYDMKLSTTAARR